MSNKTDLQLNNSKLQTILETVQSLPTINPWGGGTDIVAGTQDTIIPAYTNKELTVKGDADLLPENIKAGLELFGVLGTLQEGVDLLTLLNLTKINYDYITPTSRNANIPYTLGETPKFILVSALQNFTNIGNGLAMFGAICFNGNCFWGGPANISKYHGATKYMEQGTVSLMKIENVSFATNTMTIEGQWSSILALEKGVEYEIITMA